MNTFKELESKSEELMFYEDGYLKFNPINFSCHQQDFITQVKMLLWNVFPVQKGYVNGKR